MSILKPKGLSQDALTRLSCGDALEHFQLRRPAFPFSFSCSPVQSRLPAMGCLVQHLEPA